MTFTELFKECRKKLGNETADFDLTQLFKSYFNNYNQIIKHDAQVEPEDIFIFQMKVKRLAEGYPLQYLLGEWEFYGIPLKVGEGVLIPRPDTETIVDTALELATNIEHSKIADLCSGSGAIALALAKNLPKTNVYAVELSDIALQYLCNNVILNNLTDKITIIKGDINKMSELELPTLDMVVSNPPYIRKRDISKLSIQVSHEPEIALDGGEDGLEFYKIIAKASLNLLKPGGTLIFEAGYNQADDILDILLDNGYKNIGYRYDFNKIKRCIYGFKLN